MTQIGEVEADLSTGGRGFTRGQLASTITDDRIYYCRTKSTTGASFTGPHSVTPAKRAKVVLPQLQDTVRLSADGLAKVLGDLEARVLRAVWALSRPATARDVHELVAVQHVVQVDVCQHGGDDSPLRCSRLRMDHLSVLFQDAGPQPRRAAAGPRC